MQEVTTHALNLCRLLPGPCLCRKPEETLPSRPREREVAEKGGFRRSAALYPSQYVHTEDEDVHDCTKNTMPILNPSKPLYRKAIVGAANSGKTPQDSGHEPHGEQVGLLKDETRMKPVYF